VYSPRTHIDRRWRDYFNPTELVDAGGQLNPDIQDDALDSRFRNKETVVKMAAGQR
jgi:hypothetical protein